MKFDDILNALGEFGPYQKRVYALVCIIVLPSAWSAYIQVLAMGYGDYWCQVPGWNDTLCEEYTGEPCDLKLKKRLNIPLVHTNESMLQFQKCARYNISDFSSLNTVVVNENDTAGHYSLIRDLDADNIPDVIPCDYGWEYDQSLYKRTFAQEMDLVCNDAKYIQFPQSFYYGGYLVGSAVFGALGDRFGRQRMMIVTTIVRIIAGYGLVLVHNYWAFAVIRFFSGACNIGTYILAYVLITEFVGVSNRRVTGMLIHVSEATGYALFAAISYFIRDWRTLQIALVTPFFTVFLILIVLPESPRWLLSRGDTERARKILRHAARVNKVQLPEDFLDDNDVIKKDDTKTAERRPNCTDLFRHKNMCKRTFILMYIWSVCAVVYHGFNLSTASLGINLYLSFLVSAVIEIPAGILTAVVVERPWFGRRRTGVISLLVGGGACLLTICIPTGPYRAAVAYVGKFGITSSFAVIYLYTAEVYPTLLRTVGMGFCSMVGRVANILAPLVLLTADYWIHAPLLIFGTCTVLAGFLTLLLPETLGKRLPETIEEGENFHKLPVTTELSYPANGFHHSDTDVTNGTVDKLVA